MIKPESRVKLDGTAQLLNRRVHCRVKTKTDPTNKFAIVESGSACRDRLACPSASSFRPIGAKNQE